MAELSDEPAMTAGPGRLNPEPLGIPVRPTPEDLEQAALPALGAPGQPVVQINVEEDMEIGGGSCPVNEGATDYYGLARGRTLAVVSVAAIVTLLLAFPVVWGLVELFALAGLVGPLIWGWAIVLVGMVIAVVVLGYRIAQSGL